jgi:hypothetical protein
MLTLPQVLLILMVSGRGLLVPEFYVRESLNWQAQSVGQDMLDAFLIVPVLVVSSIGAWKNKRIALPIWAGVNLYLVYTFLIYCFDVHFNNLFLVYCAILGLSIYSLAWYFYKQAVEMDMQIQVPGSFFPVKLTAVYFIGISCLFCFLWLSEIIPSVIHKQTPILLKETGLLTNPVYVIDLAVLLPALFITGVLLSRKKILGYRLAPSLLTFMFLMDCTIGFLAEYMKYKGIESGSVIAIVMSGLALFTLVLLAAFLKLSGKSMHG